MGRLRRSADRDDFLAAHLLVRRCVARLLDVPVAGIAILQRCATCGGPHGRPEVVGYPEVTASLAHSRGVVAAVAAFGLVGIDVEALPGPDRLGPGELVAVLTPVEAAAIEAAPEPGPSLLRQWARKEALLKAGAATLEGLAELDLSGLPLVGLSEHLRLRTCAAGEWGGGDWTVHDWSDHHFPAVGALATPAGTEASLAAE